MSKQSTKLRFEDAEKKPQSKLSHVLADMSADLLSNALPNTQSRSEQEDDDENVAAESVQTIKDSAESGARRLLSAHRSRTHTSAFASNTQQKRRIKKEYAAAKRNASKNSAKAARKTTEALKAAARKVKAYAASHSHAIVIGGVIALLGVFLLNTVTSCSMMAQSTVSAIAATTYPLEDADMLSAEAQYSAKEDELQAYLDSYERTHSYSEYHYDLDLIEHDPYVLISAITAIHGGEWTVDEVGDILDLLFEKQYILTESVQTQTRYRSEQRTGYRVEIDPYTGEAVEVPYQYTVQVPYQYTICSVTLENFDLSHVPVYIMTEDQLSMYSTYMGTLGNRPDLWRDSDFVGLYYDTEYEDYEIPPEALEDEVFAAMIGEAEKYLGYPYVWGGSNPSTSFDCSGFVSWVLGHSGWEIGRQSAESLRQMSTAVSPANAKPGDLIFFQNTYDTRGASHVGIYVGENRMIHCGDPIQYARVDTAYWQEHFLSFGRIDR